ncbi:hypothetical protein ACLKA7_015963 [Drosophila subpalustris]
MRTNRMDPMDPAAAHSPFHMPIPKLNPNPSPQLQAKRVHYHSQLIRLPLSRLTVFADVAVDSTQVERVRIFHKLKTCSQLCFTAPSGCCFSSCSSSSCCSPGHAYAGEGIRFIVLLLLLQKVSELCPGVLVKYTSS